MLCTISLGNGHIEDPDPWIAGMVVPILIQEGST